MSPIKAPTNLPELVRVAFNKAKANGDVNFYPTQVAVLTPASTPFQLRFSPTLANKPKPPPSTSSSTGPDQKRKTPFNPFENPPPQLTVTPIGNDHNLVLNKFAVVPEHAILITRAFKPQTHLLEADDLAATYACIRAYHDYRSDCHPHESSGVPLDGVVAEEEEGLFAFFNCGEHSGASQPHRHLQLLPIARMRDGLADGGEGKDDNDNGHKAWSILASQLADPTTAHDSTRVPFATFAAKLTPDATADELHAIYRQLYRRACHAAKVSLVDPVENEDQDDEAAKISYNLAMTRHAMVLCPRTAEGGAVVDREGREVGKLSVNGTVLAGTALVKSEAEWNALRSDPAQLWAILEKIGLPPGAVSTTTAED